MIPTDEPSDEQIEKELDASDARREALVRPGLRLILRELQWRIRICPVDDPYMLGHVGGLREARDLIVEYGQ